MREGTNFMRLKSYLMIISTTTLGVSATHASQSKDVKKIDSAIIEQSSDFLKNFNAHPANAFSELKTYNEIAEMGSKAAWNEKTRSPASVPSEALMSIEYREMRDRFLNAKTDADIASLMNDLTDPAKFSKFPRDLQFFAARVRPVKAFAGMVYRMQKITSRTRMAQEMALGALRGILEQIHIRFADLGIDGSEDLHAVALFQYLTKPQAGYLSVCESEASLQNYFASHIYNEIKESAKIIEGMNLSDPIVMDAKLRFGIDSFGSAKNMQRFHFIGEGEKFAILARMHRRMAGLATFVAFDFRGFVDYRKELGQKYGWDVGNIFTPIGGLTREERVNVTKAGKFRKDFPNLFALKSTPTVKYEGPYAPLKDKMIPIGQSWTMAAYQHFHLSVGYVESAWKAFQNKEHGSSFVVDNELFEAQSDEITETIANMRGLTASLADAKSEFTLYSKVKKKAITVNFREFFVKPPQSLNDLLPTSFAKGEAGANSDSLVTRTVAGQKVSYRDYERGRAIGWNKKVYSNLFPEILNDKAQVDDYQGALISSRGGRMVSTALMSFVR